MSYRTGRCRRCRSINIDWHPGAMGVHTCSSCGSGDIGPEYVYEPEPEHTTVKEKIGFFKTLLWWITK